MAWCQGVDGTRLLIAPDPAAAALGTGSGPLLSLRHPKSGNKACYRLADRTLQEVHWFKQTYTSWFLGDYVCEGQFTYTNLFLDLFHFSLFFISILFSCTDGGLYFVTPVDPVFILLPIFYEARMKKGDDDPGKFRQLDEILFIDAYPGYQHLMSIAENCMQVVCEMKEIGSSKFFRLDDSKVIAWLYCKVLHLKLALPSLDKKYATMDEKTALTEAVKIVGEYIKNEAWLKLLCKYLNIDMTESSKMGSEFESSLASKERKLLEQASNSFQGQEGSGNKKSKRGGKQVKKTKLETQSRNIKDMFSKKKS
ncbi:Ribonuclease H2 subunit B [Linum perenne]